MTDSLPPDTERYCIMCGAPLTFTKISVNNGHGEASWSCSKCGHRSGASWEEVSFTSGAPDAQDISPLDDDQSPPLLWVTPPPPPPPPSPAIIPDAAIKATARYEELSSRIHTKGIVAIVQAAIFPLFALDETQERFLPQGHGWGSRWSAEIASISSLNLGYAGPSYKDVKERIIIDQKDRESEPHLLATADETEMSLDAYLVSLFLTNLPGSNTKSFGPLLGRDAIFQFVNVETISQAPVQHVSIELQSGEVISWAIRRIKAPLPIAHAQAQFERTIIDVGAIGPAADDLEQVLGQLTRLTPESPALDRLNQGLQAWMEYIQNQYWTDNNSGTP